MLGKRMQCGQFFGWIIDQFCRSENDYRAIVHRVVEDRTGEHKSVKQRNRNANGNSGAQVLQHAARRRAVNIKVVADATVAGGNNEWLSVDDEANMTNEALVENLVDDVAVVHGSLWFTNHTGACRRRG